MSAPTTVTAATALTDSDPLATLGGAAARPGRRSRRCAVAGLALGLAGVVAGLVPAPPAAAAEAPRSFSIDANSLTSLTQQETNITRGDEVYVASIAFRSTPGQAGSTTAWFTGGLSDITNVHQGETHTIPNAMGRVTFSNVTRLSAADLLAGQSPEVLGTISLVFESDLTLDSRINSMMADVADVVEVEVGELLEDIELAELGSDEFTEALADAIADIEDQITPSTLQKIGLFLGSFGDPDDLVEFKVNVFVAVDDSLAPLVDQLVGGAIPAGDGFGGALRNRTYNQTFTGAGASYRLGFAVN